MLEMTLASKVAHGLRAKSRDERFEHSVKRLQWAYMLAMS